MALYIINIDLELGASGTSYTAPANGWYFLRFTNGNLTNHWANVSLNGTFVANWWAQVSNNSFGISPYPVKKGDVLSLSYGSDITGAIFFRFYYAEGTPSA